ncbi:MAG: hypothetical protein JWO99_294 [Candidatus Saccharibacteria bacterium]|nr:hypothetical protein [Candidatus Saccharibacteria bacterium]
MRRNIIKALLIAMFAIVFFAVVPSVSASAATGGAAPVGCSPATCTASPGPVRTLTPKDPSQDVAPPQGTVPLNLNGCEVSNPCTNVPDPEAVAPPGSDDVVQVSVHQLKIWDNQLRDAQVRAFVSLICAISAGGIAIILLIMVVSVRINRRQPEVVEVAKVGPTFH